MPPAMRRTLFILSIVPVSFICCTIAIVSLACKGVRWIFTGKPVPADPMPRWLEPLFNLPDRILGR